MQKTKRDVISVRQFWEEVVEPSKKIDNTLRKYGLERYFECLVVEYITESPDEPKLYASFGDVAMDKEVDMMCIVHDIACETSADGGYVYRLALSKIE